MSSASLPEYCQSKSSQTAVACIDKCYEEEVERESRQSEQGMGWDIMDSMFGILIQGDGDDDTKFANRMGAVGKIGGIITGIGGAIFSNMHTQENLNAQNCEQLSAVLITTKLVVMDEKLDEIKTHLQAAIAAIDRTHRKLVEVHAAVQHMEKKNYRQIG